jgi:hypothetical protein
MMLSLWSLQYSASPVREVHRDNYGIIVNDMCIYKNRHSLRQHKTVNIKVWRHLTERMSMSDEACHSAQSQNEPN